MDVADLLGTKPSEMRMCLYLRPIHPEFFTIFALRTYKGTNFEAELWITGLSHVFTVRRVRGRRAEERCVTEVIGPSSLELPERGLVERVALAGENEASFALKNGFQYHLSFQAETLKELEVFTANYDELRRQGFKEGLSCEYRLQGVSRSLWPLAITVPTQIRDGFLLHAFHIFPDYQTILKTQTLIEMRHE